MPPLAGAAIAITLTLAALIAALAVGDVALGPGDVIRGLFGQGSRR